MMINLNSSRINNWLALVLILCCIPCVYSNEQADIQKIYQQVKKIHRENPVKAIELWQQYKDKAALLPEKVQYLWHQYTVIALMVNADYTQAAQELGQLVYTKHAQNQENKLTLSNLAGVTFGYMDKPHLAQKAYQCALKQQPQKPLIQARLLHNLALSQVNRQQIDFAIDNFQQALKIANEQNAYKKIALYSANLGYAYLYRGQPQKALPYFRRTLFLDEQHNNTNHKIKAGLYLLNTVAQLKQWSAYDRYFDSVNKMVDGRTEYWIENYFTWVKALAKSLRSGIKPSETEQLRLLEELNDEKNARALRNDYLPMAKLLGIELPNNQPVRVQVNNVDDTKLKRFISDCIKPNAFNYL